MGVFINTIDQSELSEHSYLTLDLFHVCTDICIQSIHIQTYVSVQPSIAIGSVELPGSYNNPTDI